MDKKMLVLLGLGAAVWVFKDELGFGVQEEVKVVQPGDAYGGEIKKDGLREYLEKAIKLDSHFKDDKADKYYWWFYLKAYYGIKGEPPLPQEITFFSDTELIPLSEILSRFKGFQVGVYGEPQ